jgi:sulfoxide reductase catalytic subunit YedY
MLIKKPVDIKSSEITAKELYLNRRQFMLSASATAVTAGAALAGFDIRGSHQAFAAETFANVKKSSYSTNEKQNAFKDITNYNNFYELGPDKEDPAANAKYFTPTRPWTVAVEGEVKKPKTYDIDALTKLSPLEERVYRSLVHGNPVDRLSFKRANQTRRTYGQRKIYPIRDLA